MRHLLVAGTALILGLAAWTAHPSEEIPVGPRIVRRSPRVEAPEASSRAGVKVVEERRVVSERNLPPLPPPAGGKSAAPTDVRHVRMQAQTLALMQRELALSTEQSSQLAGVFRDRQQDIDAYHREVRTSGVFRQKDYDRRIGEIRVTYYARMVAFMDSRQARRFQELIYGGQFGDGIFFDQDPNLVVLE